MDTDSLFEVPLYFIKEYLNGWVIIVIICVIIYFIALRTYYIKREQFFDQSMNLKNMEDIEDYEENINNIDNENNDDSNYNNNDNSDEKEIKKIDVTVNSKANKKLNKKKRQSGENNTVLIGTHVFEGLDDINSNSNNTKNTTNTTIEGFEGFETPMTTTYASITTSSTTKPSTTQPSITQPSITQPQIINTTLFDNLQINTIQINLCKTNYTQVINTYISDLSKLVKLKKNNEYLNVKTQFNVIIGKGVDNIINYLSNTIKSPIILTRTSIKTDVINSLSNTLEQLINKQNNDITKQMNSLAMMNSTTINYNTMLNNIDESRTKLEDYIEIDKLVVNNGTSLNNFSKEVNNVLNKSYILPIYEKNFDKISQLVKSDFNENETNMANKYGQAYTDFLNEKKKGELDINPMRLASKIESGIVDMLTNLVGSGSDSGSSSSSGSGNGNISIDKESFFNPIPEQQYNLVTNTNTSLNDNANIYKDKGNLGNYLIDKKTQKQVLEGFEDGTSTTSPSTTSPSTTSPSTTSPSTTKTSKTNKDILSSLMSGDFLQYIMEIINDKMGMLYGMYDNKFNGNKNNSNSNMKFNLEENMIPAGFLLFILSMLIYFIDTTS